MGMFSSALRSVSDAWSLVVGMGITGRFFAKKQVTIHYPRQVVDFSINKTFSGPIQLVALDKDPTKSRCIACMACVTICPSKCITVVKAKPPKLTEEQEKALKEAQERGENVKRPPAPREPEVWVNDFSLCCLCGLCIESCPTDAIEFSHDIYLAGNSRKIALRNLIAPYPGHPAIQDATKSEEK